MPAFRSPCLKPGCHAASYQPYCSKHTRSRERQPERPRPSRRKALHKGGAGYGRAHDRWRKLVLAADPICRWPLGGERYCQQPAVEADHVKPIRLHPELRYDLDNGQGLCRRHHSLKTSRERSDGEWDVRPNDLQPASIPVSIVCGPPASGKSTYVEKHKSNGDIVIDLDEIRAEIAEAPLYHAEKRWMKPALEERNRRLRQLSEPQTAARCWFIVGAPTREERDWWQSNLGAESVKVLAVKPDKCIDRIQLDHRRPLWVKKENARAIRKWWALFLRGKTRAPNILERGAVSTGE